MKKNEAYKSHKEDAPSSEFSHHLNKSGQTKKIGFLKYSWWKYIIILTISVPLFFHLIYLNRIYPGVSIAGINLSGKTQSQAQQLLISSVYIPEEIVLFDSQNRYEIPLDAIEFSYDLSASVKQAYNYRRNTLKQNILTDLSFFLPSKINLPLHYTLNEEQLNKYLSLIVSQANKPPVYPEIKMGNNGVYLTPGVSGFEINQEILRRDVGQVFNENKSAIIPISGKYIDVSISQTQEQITLKRATILYTKELNISYGELTNNYQKEDLAKAIAYTGEINQVYIGQIVSEIKNMINQKPENPVFNFTGGKVTEFIPAKNGLSVQESQLTDLIIQAVNQLENTKESTKTISVPVNIIHPEIETGEINDFGIKTLLGRGVSKFAGSIPSRVFNLSLASSKLNGILIKPNEIFSFNQIIGDANKEAGYQEAYIIKDGQTILGDGGGLCQVSTTLFRAVLNSGLPVIERRAHSYRVSYYEQGSPPGIDATVYYPTSDFKFKNDTPAHLLIQTRVDKKTASLTFEIYGTNDGRAASLSKPVISGTLPPPEDLYIDDPTLPAGQIKQIDWKAWGAKVSFSYEVARDGVVIYRKTFKSDYQPWQAKFLRGTLP